jgi:hypothetical protein
VSDLSNQIDDLIETEKLFASVKQEEFFIIIYLKESLIFFFIKYLTDEEMKRSSTHTIMTLGDLIEEIPLVIDLLQLQ